MHLLLTTQNVIEGKTGFEMQGIFLGTSYYFYIKY